MRNAEPSVRCFLQYDRLYVENEVFLYNEVEEKVERMLMNRLSVDNSSLITPRSVGGRSSRMKKRSESRAGGDNIHNTKLNNGDIKEEDLTELEAEIIQTGELLIVKTVMILILFKETT